MAKGGSKAYRDKSKLHKGHTAFTYNDLLGRQNELIGWMWEYDRMLSVRNLIIKRLQEYLTPEEKEALAGK